MKIGVDLRFLEEDDLFSDFVIEIITKLIKESNTNIYIIYINDICNIKQYKNIIIKKINIHIGSIKEQTIFYKTLKKDNNNLMLFFNIYKPIMYKKDYYLFIPSLNKIYYQNFETYFKKYKFLYFLNKTTKNAKKIICFDENTKDELLERLDIKESKIFILKPFFTGYEKLKHISYLKIDIKVKNNIKNDFLLYSGGIGIEKNIDKLVKVFHKLNENGNKIDLVILGEEIAKDIRIRDLIIKESMQKNIHFIGKIGDEEKINYYNSSIGVIFPSLYESFPFHLNEAVFFNTNIITGNIKNIKNIFGESISYFFAISTTSIVENISLFLQKRGNPNYTEVLNKINSKNTVKELIKIIN